MFDLIPFGVLVKPHGLKGCISCRLFNKKSKVLKKKLKIYFNNNANNFLTIETINYSSKNCLIKFFEIFDRNKIEEYRNLKFCIDKSNLPILTNDENYFIDFIGSTLFNKDKMQMGVVQDIIPIKNNDILVLDSPEGEKMIPFAKDLILFFDKDKKELVMDIYSGIIE